VIDLNDMRRMDIEELIVRVHRYEAGVPVGYQAIAKLRAAPSGPWGVGMRSNPEAAVSAALEEAARHICDGFRAAHPEIAAAAPAAPSKYGF